MMSNNKGFTLIEVLVALFIFAILAVMASLAIGNVMRQYRHLTQTNRGIGQLQVAMIRFERDTVQMIPRPVAGPGGNPLLPVIADGSQLEFTQAGNVNPFNQASSDLQRVAYQVMKNNLVRVTWPVLDRATTTKPLFQPILAGVNSLQFQYIDNSGKAYSYWPINNDANGVSSDDDSSLFALPTAIEITMQIKGLGQVVRVIPISGALNVG